MKILSRFLLVLVTSLAITACGGGGSSSGDSGPPSSIPDITPEADGVGGDGSPTSSLPFSKTGLSGLAGSYQTWVLTLPAGLDKLTVTTSLGVGDVDLIVTNPNGLQVCTSQNDGNDEECIINNPLAGEWQVELYGYDAYTGVTLTAGDTSGTGDTGDTGGDVQGPVLVKDIRSGLASSDPTGLFKLGDTLFFSAFTGERSQFWKSDGTEAGTVMVKDRPSMSCLNNIPYRSYILGGVVYFQDCGNADDNILTTGIELWKTDGTEAGTLLVKDILPGSADSGVSSFSELNGILYFGANDGVNGRELWKSDGTAVGTVMVKDIASAYLGLGSFPTLLTNMDDVLYFSADDGVNSIELWKSDGTEAGTVMVKNINVSGSSAPENLINVNGTLFFYAWDGIHGRELWKSDGSEAGTVMVKDIKPGSGHSTVSNPSFINVNDTLFFVADDGVNGGELWKSDGTEVGTMMVKDIHSSAGVGGVVGDFTEVNGILFFIANDGVHGDELWKSDGTEPGTGMVKDIAPGIIGANPLYLTNVDGVLYFAANDNNTVYGREIWKSDGTETGTVPVTDIRAGSANANPNNLTNVNGTLFFSADDGVHSYGGGELWKLDTSSQ